MRRSFSPFSIFEYIRDIVSSVILGTGFGIFAHGYWLIDYFPIGSRRLFYAALLAGFLGSAGYFLLFRWMRDRFSNLPVIHRAGLVAAGVLIGVFLFFASTEQWREPSRYITMFLPVHTLEFSIPSGQATDEVSISWFTTSLGEVSYGTVQSQGWIREDGRLTLVDPSDNRFRWEGKTGEIVQIVFQSSSEVDVAVSWDGHEETLTLPGNLFTYQRSFDVSFYASRVGMILLGILHFSILSVVLCLIVWEKRFDLLQSLNHGLVEKRHRFTGQDGVLLVAVIVCACLLRVPNLESLFPTADEYSHLNAAKQIAQGNTWNPAYTRSLWLVTLPVSLAFKVFGYEIWAARLAGILFNVLAMVPLYLIAIKINRPVAILSILLYATSPWVISMARIAREYAYYPFYYYWIVFLMILFLEGLPKGIRILRDWRDLIAPSRILMGLALLLPLLYAFLIDPSSTFKVILIAYVVFGFFVFLRLDLKDKKDWILVLMASGVLFLIVFTLSGKHLDLRGFNLQPLDYFFPNPQQQWYYHRFSILPAIGLLGGMVTGFLIRRRNFIPIFLFALFAGFLGAFMFSSIPHLGPRHLSAAQFFYVILTSFGLYLFWILMRTHLPAENRFIGYSVALVLGILVMNGRQIVLPLVSHDSYMPITEHYHPDLGQVQEYLLAHAQAEDALIASNVYSSYAAWMGGPDFSAIHLILLKTGEEDVFSVINQYDSGWIVVDKIWLERIAFSPFESFRRLANVEYLGEFGDVYLWRWHAG